MDQNNIYNITVTTSNIQFAGTDANVYILLSGKFKKSGKLLLKNSKTNRNPFEKGKTDVFQIECEDVDPLVKIRIGHDGKGISPGWHLENVIIESKISKTKWLCECNKWFDAKEGDGKTERLLLAVEQPAGQSLRRNEDNFRGSERQNDDKFDYYNQTKSKKRNDLDPYLNDSYNQSKYNNLDSYNRENSASGRMGNSPRRMNDSSRRREESFRTLENSSRRSEEQFRRLENSPGRRDDSFITEHFPSRRDDAQKNMQKFPLGKNDSPRRLESFRQMRNDSPRGIENSPRRKRNTIYKVFVTTSDIKFAGTDANVFVDLFGPKLNTGKILLEKSKTNRNKFEQGKSDFFEIEGIDVGELEMIRIGHDNSGLGPGWHLKEVKVELENGQAFMFPCNQWFDKKEHDGKIERDLFPEEHKKLTHKDYRDLLGSSVDYEILVSTSDIQNAGTDADVYVKVYGDLDRTKKIFLDKSRSHRNKFERGNKDLFEIEHNFLGTELLKLKIGHDGSGIGAGWHLKEITIKCIQTQQQWIFVANRWIDINEGDGSLEIELMPSNGDILHNESTQYDIKVFTGNEPKSGTDSNVFLTIYGEKGETHENALTQSSTHYDNFERGQVDKFSITNGNLGQLYGVRVRHDNTGVYPSWFLDRIEITDKLKKKTYYFNCQKWFSLAKDDGRIERLIKEKNYLAKKPSKAKDKKQGKKKIKITSKPLEKIYYVKFYTGSKQLLSGTDMNVFIRIFGDNGTSSETKLKQSKSHEKQFERSQIDLFTVQTEEDLGTLFALEIKCEQCLKNSNDLHIQKVQISFEGYEYEFRYNSIVTANDIDKRFNKYILLENNAEF